MTSEMLLGDQYLRVINQRGKERKNLKRVYRNMRREGLYMRAYANLYSNKGATTPGSDPADTIQGMSIKRVRRIIQKLGNGVYLWKPTRRIEVPKANGKKRPISIPGWNDKMVQEVIRLVLEAYYEPRFLDSSHGFRPNRGCHTALETIKSKWTGTKWFIEGDIRSCFDEIDHNLIINLLKRDIHDNRFIKLVKGMLKAGYMEDWRYFETHSGVPQGGVVSPILSNIVLDQLDVFVEDVLIPKYTKGKRRRVNPDYQRVQDRRGYHKSRGNWERYTEEGKKMRQIPCKDPQDPNYRRLRYIRYADDFLLGFVGPKKEAEAIKEEVGEFLRTLKLEISPEKTKITHARNDRARFLGYDIGVSWSNIKVHKTKNNVKVRQVNGNIRLEVPKDVVTKWVGKYTRKGRAIHLGQYIHLSDYEMVATFGAQLRGIAQYYMLAIDVSKKLNRVYWVCTESLRMTLRNKHKGKLNKTQSYVRYKHRSEGTHERTHFRVTVERDGKRPLIAKCGELPLRTKRTSYLRDELPPYVIQGKNSELIKRLLANECELCGKKGELEAHHVNKVSNLKRRWGGKKSKPEWVKWMIARNRKTIVVCTECHKKITVGKYDDKKVG
jgi:group II intron reverse transcriptase/maturase